MEDQSSLQKLPAKAVWNPQEYRQKEKPTPSLPGRPLALNVETDREWHRSAYLETQQKTVLTAVLVPGAWMPPKLEGAQKQAHPAEPKANDGLGDLLPSTSHLLHPVLVQPIDN